MEKDITALKEDFNKKENLLRENALKKETDLAEEKNQKLSN